MFSMEKGRGREIGIIAGIVLLLGAAVFLLPSQEGPTGFVTFTGPVSTLLFNSSNITLTCNVTSPINLSNVSITLANALDVNITRTVNVSGLDISEDFLFTGLANGDYDYTCSACTNVSCNQSATQALKINYTSPHPFSGLVMNLTFDDSSNPWKDYSSAHHAMVAHGDLTQADGDVCKWYGCADMTANGGDFLSSTINFDPEKLFAVSFWYYPIVSPTNADQWYFTIGSDSNSMLLQEGDYGLNADWNAVDGRVGSSIGSSYVSGIDEWTHYFIEYDGTNYLVWKNAQLVYNSTFSKGALLPSLDAPITIGQGSYGIDLDGYLDEFLMYTNTSFTSNDVKALYDEQKLGTPPRVDIFVSNISYELPFDWSDPRNRLDPSQPLNVTVIIKNEGYESSGSFDYQFILNDTTRCQGSMSLGPGEAKPIYCVLSLAEGFYKGSVIVDVQDDVHEDNEENNVQRVYIPFMDRPWFHFTSDEWDADLLSLASDSSYPVANADYNWAKSFSCDPFQQSYTGNNVDPYGKKARECALSCFMNNYAEPDYPSKQQCTYAKEHLLGWSSIDPSTYTNVQSIHELVHVAIAYDLMFPTLTKEENENITRGFHAICQQITNLPNTRPDLDLSGVISGGNGWGFGSGMGGFCYAILGSYAPNPTLIQDVDQDYWGKNIPDSWMAREQSYLKGFKNDSFATYQEGWLYKFYSQFHMVENLWFEKRYDLNNVSDYSNALCSMGHDFTMDALDFDTNGHDLRNDENRFLRGISRGDSNSYEDPGSSSIVKYAIITYYGLLCDDPTIKKEMLYLRDLSHEKHDDGLAYLDSYLYPQLYNEVGETPSDAEINQISPKFSFDNANDIVTIRTNYTYVNDTVIQIDGGEERGSGHSQAQGYFLYALGEPFLDDEQVPYEDDVRAETWKNGISLQTTTQSVEGTQGTYSQACGNAPLNQYYGMRDCPLTGSYPDYRQFPLEYGGDVEDYIGTSDASFAGAYVWRPYKDADPVQEYFVKFGDVLVKRTVVSNNVGGQVYHNFINIYDEFTETRSGDNLTFSRDGKNLDIDVIDSTSPLTLGGGDSGVNYCFAKTSCENNYRGAGTYRRTYLHAAATDIDFILAHHWYTDGGQFAMTKISGTDKGVAYANKSVVFDSNNNGFTDFDGVETNGWALAVTTGREDVGAFNATSIKIDGDQLFSSSLPVSVFIDRSTSAILLTINSMSRQVGIDYPRTVTVTLDAGFLENNSGFAVRDTEGNIVALDSQSGTTLSFTVTPGQNSDTYTITGSSVTAAPPIVTPEAPEVFFSSNPSSPILFRCSARDESAVVNLSILINTSGSIATLASSNPGAAQASLNVSSSFDNGTYSWACYARDDAANAVTSAYRIFTVGAVVENVSENVSVNVTENVTENVSDNTTIVSTPSTDTSTTTSSSSGGGGGGSSVFIPSTPSQNESNASNDTPSLLGEGSNGDSQAANPSANPSAPDELFAQNVTNGSQSIAPVEESPTAIHDGWLWDLWQKILSWFTWS